MAAPDPARLRRLNDALLSVYFYGRQGSPALNAAPPRAISIQPLGAAVTELTAPPHDEALRPMRLAILDLCRTRAAASLSPTETQYVDERITDLAKGIAAATNIHPDALVSQFTALFQMHGTSTGEEAYMHAMRLLAPSFDSNNHESVELISWKEGI